jgi:hypothetical protein
MVSPMKTDLFSFARNSEKTLSSTLFGFQLLQRASATQESTTYVVETFRNFAKYVFAFSKRILFPGKLAHERLSLVWRNFF